MPQFILNNNYKRHWAASPVIGGRPFKNNWLLGVTACGVNSLNRVGFHCIASENTKAYIKSKVTCKNCLRILEKEIPG